MPPPPAQADLVVLAGDIARPAQAIEWAQGFGRPVLYVLGNHEFYGGSIDGTLAQARRLGTGTRVTVLQQDGCVIDGVRFLGATLWSDFSLHDEATRNALARQEAARLIHDSSRIRRHEALPAPLTPDDSTQLSIPSARRESCAIPGAMRRTASTRTRCSTRC